MQGKYCFSVLVNGTNHTAYFVKAYFDSDRIEYISNESNNNNNNSIVTAVLIVLIFVGFLLGLIIMFAFLKARLESNGHNLKEMMRRKQTLENEANNDGNTSTSEATRGELRDVVSANNNIDEDPNKDDGAKVAVAPLSDLKLGEEDIPL